MLTGLYSAQADSIPILRITGQAPRARPLTEDFQAVDIAAIAEPVTKWGTTVLEPAQVPRAFRQAFHLMRSSRRGPVLIESLLERVARIAVGTEIGNVVAFEELASSRAGVPTAVSLPD